MSVPRRRISSSPHDSTDGQGWPPKLRHPCPQHVPDPATSQHSTGTPDQASTLCSPRFVLDFVLGPVLSNMSPLTRVRAGPSSADRLLRAPAPKMSPRPRSLAAATSWPHVELLSRPGMLSPPPLQGASWAQEPRLHILLSSSPFPYLAPTLRVTCLPTSSAGPHATLYNRA